MPHATAEEVICRCEHEIAKAIDACVLRKRHLAGLILLYSGIDIMASLNRRQSHKEVTRADFIDWCKEFLLENSGLHCTGEDLYAARCAILHSFSSESRRSRAGEVREILYAWGSANLEYLQFVIDRRNHNAVAIRAEGLIAAFRRGITRFAESVGVDKKRACLVVARGEKILSNIRTGVDGLPDAP